MHEESERAAGILLRLWRFAQWAIAIVFAVLSFLIALSFQRHLSSPGAPVTLFWVAIGLLTGAALAVSPPVFFRLPKLAKLASYGALTGAILFTGTAISGASEAYERTPEGKREKAANLAREIAEAKAERSEQTRLAQVQAAQAADNREAQKEEVCRTLVPQVVEMAQEQHGIEIIELNNVFAGSMIGPDKPLTCFADATTSQGDKAITFGLEKTPQGQTLVNLEMPR